jgi:DUF4097 and DUF4098 domain-containing protein YvlB
MVRRTPWTTLLAAAVVGLLAFPARGAEEYTQRIDQERVIEFSGQKLEVTNLRGLIRIRPSKGNVVTIEAEKVVYADSEEEARELFEILALNVHQEQMGSLLSIVAGETEVTRKRSLFRFMGRLESPHIDLELEVPDGCVISVESSSGDIDIIGTSCDLTISSASSNCEVSSHEGSLRAELTSGRVRLERLEGPVVVSCTSGNVDVSDVTGEVDIHVTGGDVHCTDIDGDLEARTGTGDGFVSGGEGRAVIESTTGDVEVVSREGPVSIDTGGGDVIFWVDPLPSEVYELNTSSGDIEFRLPVDASAIVTVWTTSGEIYAKVPMRILAVSRNNLKGKVGDGDSAVTFKTISGSVRILPMR